MAYPPRASVATGTNARAGEEEEGGEKQEEELSENLAHRVHGGPTMVAHVVAEEMQRFQSLMTIFLTDGLRREDGRGFKLCLDVAASRTGPEAGAPVALEMSLQGSSWMHASARAPSAHRDLSACSPRECTGQRSPRSTCIKTQQKRNHPMWGVRYMVDLASQEGAQEGYKPGRSHSLSLSL